MRDARIDPAQRRLSRSASTRRRTCCATTSASHRRRAKRPMPRWSRRSTRSKRARGGRSPLTYFEFSTLAALRLFAQRAARRRRARSRARRTARRRQRRRCRRRRRHDDRYRSRRLSRPDARGHRPREGGHLPRRPAGDLRRPDPPRVARRARARDRRAAVAARPRLRLHGVQDRSGDTGVRGRRALGSAVSRAARRLPARQRRDGARGARRVARSAAGRRAARSATDWSRSSCRGGSRCCPDARRSCSTSRTIRMPRARSRDTLGAMGFHPATLAVFGMLADKDIDGVVAAMRARIDRWYVATLPGPRGASGGAPRRRAARTPASTAAAIHDVRRHRARHSRRRVTRRAKLIESWPSDRF